MAEERAKLEQERQAVEEARRKAEAAEAARQARIAAEAEAKAKAERERVEAEERAREEAERKAEHERRMAELRPDAEKLAAYADALLAVPVPTVAVPYAQATLETASRKLGDVAYCLRTLDAPPGRVIDPGQPEDFE